MYYLETNALRAISRKLRGAPIEIRRTLFTSVLAIFELVSGITECDYSLRRAFLCDVSKSKLRIDWRSSSQVIANSFGHSVASDPITITTRKAFDVVVGSSSLVDAVSACERHRPPIDLVGLIAANGRLSRVYGAARAQQNTEYRNQLDSEPLKSVLAAAEIGSASARRAFTTDIAGDLDEKLLQDCASATAQKMSVSGVGPADLLASYDGSIDSHIQASRWLQTESMLLQNPAGENDAPDVLHFLYVDKGTTMVSNDKLSTRIAAALWPDRVVSVPEFLINVALQTTDANSTFRPRRGA
jgi:hypothetical protein